MATTHHFESDTGLNVTSVYGVVHANDVRRMQDLITNLRLVGGIAKVYQVTNPHLLAVRGTADEVRVAEWLLTALDRAEGAVDCSMRMPGGNDDVLQVFYLSHSDREAMQSLVKEIRTTVRLNRVSQTNVPAAVVLRGTADQVALAGKLISLKDQPGQ